MCEWGKSTEISISRRVHVDSCIAPAVSRLNANGVYTTGSCCGHGKADAEVTILPSSAHRARSLGLVVEFREIGMCPVIRLSGLNAALVSDLPLASTNGAAIKDAPPAASTPADASQK